MRFGWYVLPNFHYKGEFFIAVPPQAPFYMTLETTSVPGSLDPFLINQEHLRISNFSSYASLRPHTFVFTYKLNSMLSHALASLTSVILIAILNHRHELLHIFSFQPHWLATPSCASK